MQCAFAMLFDTEIWSLLAFPKTKAFFHTDLFRCLQKPYLGLRGSEQSISGTAAMFSATDFDGSVCHRRV